MRRQQQTLRASRVLAPCCFACAAQIGTAAHELQHVANLLQPGTSADEKKFLEAVRMAKRTTTPDLSADTHGQMQIHAREPAVPACGSQVCAQNPKAVEQLLSANPNVIFARTRDWHNAWHIAAASGHLPVRAVMARAATHDPPYATASCHTVSTQRLPCLPMTDLSCVPHRCWKSCIPMGEAPLGSHCLESHHTTQLAHVTSARRRSC